MTSFEKSGAKKSLEEMIVGGNTEALDQLKEKYADLAATLEIIMDPATSSDSAYTEIRTFNDAHMNAKEGSYETIHLSDEDRDVTVKYYQNGSVSISASFRE